MNRRATLATLFGKKSTEKSTESTVATTTASPPLVLSGLDPYTDTWEYEQAAHLLRRAMFGPTHNQIKSSIQDGMEATVATLLNDLPMPSPPLNYSNEDDLFVPIGETWIEAPYSAGVNLRGARNASLKSWTMGHLLNEGVSLREKMVLFWHNHFATASTIVNDPKLVYRLHTLFRANAWGNFRELTKQVTIDPMMLRYLNGNQNRVQAPNENYARELLELFTIGKGPQVDDGDYTNYTEDDVIQMARVLTGWRDRGFVTTNPDVEVGSFFVSNRHDTGEKQLSHRFDEVVISNMGDGEYAHLIDIIFEKEEVAKFICRKIYRWFIYYKITDQAETDVIQPLAQILIDNDYEIKSVLEVFFKSQHFYDMLNIGPMIKNPVDFTVSLIKQLEMPLPPGDNLNQQYRVWFIINRVNAAMLMEIFNPPSVAGWPAYYQEPGYSRLWINSTTLPLRNEMTNRLTNQGLTANGFTVRINPLELIAQFDDPFDPNILIQELVVLLFPQPITQNQIAFLKEILIPGLPDFEWTVEYGDYVNDPTNEDLAMGVENKLRNLLTAMLTMPEYYLS
ncbi:MAG: hypothetical protein ACI9XO_001406 [Paraglaciecola sp.]|jgi:uncharacterized protein (DUF1800 family)